MTNKQLELELDKYKELCIGNNEMLVEQQRKIDLLVEVVKMVPSLIESIKVRKK